ncbi:hypothetical protein HOLleu_07219 [Holothuria leucospilota]|uniref:Uncharacterized protein n=1 Tax=Holothuria leucospilota TaxID=206669 RepID=A0A9Q1CFN2_HOLLE|nr:hypothetical protein HOLleu_07219 [Holothuria leucospilota]
MHMMSQRRKCALLWRKMAEKRVSLQVTPKKCRQLICQPFVYARKSTTRAAKFTPFVHVCCIVFTQNDVSVMSMHTVYREMRYCTLPYIRNVSCVYLNVCVRVRAYVCTNKKCGANS